MLLNPWRVVLSGLSIALLAGCTATSGESANAAAKDIADGQPCLTPEDMERMSDQLLLLTNLERANADLPPVTRVEALDRIASDFACRMIEHGFFAHHDPLNGDGPGARASRANYRYYYVGENLAAGQTSAADVMREWMASPEHRQIILSPRWRELGIGLRAGGVHGTYWVVEFAQPAKQLAPAVADALPAEPVTPQAIEPVSAPSLQVAP